MACIWMGDGPPPGLGFGVCRMDHRMLRQVVSETRYKPRWKGLRFQLLEVSLRQHGQRVKGGLGSGQDFTGQSPVRIEGLGQGRWEKP